MNFERFFYMYAIMTDKMTDKMADKTIDLDLLRCPHLLIATIHALRQLSAGQVLQIYAKDLNAPSSIAAWARQSGNELLEMYDDHGGPGSNKGFVFFLRRRAEPSYLNFWEERESQEAMFWQSKFMSRF
ncbi:MAG: sulfurtransferase TusA family protein [Ardenticatenaceae bacterium]